MPANPQVTDEMVEKAAEALFDAMPLTSGEFTDLSATHQGHLRQSAKAALTAALADHVVVSREPTEAMLDAAMFAVPAHSSARDADKCMYIAMISAAPLPQKNREDAGT